MTIHDHTLIKLKRGISNKVSSYTDAKKGEPVYNLETRKLYICPNEVGTLVPVDEFSKGYKYICSGTQSVFNVALDPNMNNLIYINGTLLDPSQYTISATSVTLNTPAQANDVVNIESIPKSATQSYEFVAGANQTVFTLSEDLPVGSEVNVYVDGALVSPGDYTFDGYHTVTFDTAPPEGSQVIINGIMPPKDVWIVVDRDFAAEVNRKYIIDTSSGVIVVDLPSTAKNGDTIRFSNGYSVFNTITINRNGNLIGGIDEDLEVNIHHVIFDLTFYNGDWEVTYIQSLVSH